MAVVSMKTLLESGVHFGHRTHKWNPKMKPYIFTERNGIHILNLQQTVKAIEEAYALIRDTVAAGGTVLFVGTKRQAQETIQMEAERCGMPYVTARWLGGMLTNWRTIRERISELERLERMKERGDFERLKKKERLNLQRQIDKLEMRLGGIRRMVGLPEMVFVVDVRREESAIHEANLLNIPVVAMVDTNCDPSAVDYVIPSNDDAIRAIKLLVTTVADAVIEGKDLRKDEDLAQEKAAREEASLRATRDRRSLVASDEDEDELTDEDLLGAATLAKLKKDDDEEEIDEEDEIEEDVEADDDEEETDEEDEIEEDVEEDDDEEDDLDEEEDADDEVEEDVEADDEADDDVEEETDEEDEIEEDVEADDEEEDDLDEEDDTDDFDDDEDEEDEEDEEDDEDDEE